MNRRGSGILLHITSLPSPYGIGDLGPGAYSFADFLSQTKQIFWQVLPLNPTNTIYGNSPYSSLSAFAGNPLLISPLLLREEGLLSKSDIEDAPSFSGNRVDYGAVTKYKEELFRKSYTNFKNRIKKDYEFEKFCSENTYWLEDYALFLALKAHFKGKIWNRWPKALRDRDKKELNRWKVRLKDRVEMEKLLQYHFFKQWFSLKSYCKSKSIQIIGDISIYVNYDSAEVWVNPEIFKLDANKKPTVVAGIPPDFWSSTGQLWGNPIYRWDFLKEMGYPWWVKRVAHNLKLLEVVRLDHFKGFNDYWEVPAGKRTAVKGKWIMGPGEDFFHTLLKHFPYLPFIAEDLGVITAEVRELRDKFELPGMRVLQFAFGNDPLADLYKPHNYIKNCVAYTGTHDNDTLISWLYGSEDCSTRTSDQIRIERENVFRYLGPKGKSRRDVHWELIRLLMMSAANLVIIPMQDIFGLGEEARMNRPAKAEGNWQWRLLPNQITSSVVKELKEMTETYGRV